MLAGRVGSAMAAELGSLPDVESLIDLDERARDRARTQVARRCRT
jgi:hypothetical protein